jgi:aminoglycoside 3-N-acetyltransferase
MAAPAEEDRHASEAVYSMLEAARVPRDSVLVVHSAFHRLSRAGYRAESFVAALADYMAPGTLLMPTMSWRSVNPENPIFDELETPGITGVLSEIFRTRFATRRSLHPTHSVAGLGRHLDQLLASHHLDETPCSARSPWGLLDDFSGHVLLIGIGMERCTLVHHVEETIAPEIYLRPSETRERYICRDRFGREHGMYARRHPRLPRDFWQFERMLDKRGGVRWHVIANTPCRAFAAREMVEVIAETLHRRPDAIITPSQDS